MIHDHVPKAVETVIIGAGQAGLAMSWYLGRAGRDHILLDRRELLGGGWRDRWNSFRLVTPNWSASFPGFPYEGEDPDGFMPRDEIAARVAGYSVAIDAPIVLGTTVERLSTRDGGGFLLETSDGPIGCRDVIVATGGFHTPKIPGVAAGLASRPTQIHSHNYTEEADLPPGAVLIVGTGQSGVQMAEELFAAGRRVYLSVGSAGRYPRRYRGKDVVWWFDQLQRHGAEFGTGLPTIDNLPDPRMRLATFPHMSGHGGGHDTNLRRMAADGITLVGHLDAIDGEKVRLAPDLEKSLARADSYFDDRARTSIDLLITRAKMDVPPDDRVPFAFDPPELPELDLAAAGISTVIWACGYRLDFGWLDLPILDDFGVPRQNRGVSAEVPGLYFIGLPWLHTAMSATLVGVGLDAEHLAGRMGLLKADEPVRASAKS
ncbi:MAG TPA: NAD(P)/FAD-dependent oxidoreductase [Candidatus Limnocylindrales bacterium]